WRKSSASCLTSMRRWIDGGVGSLAVVLRRSSPQLEVLDGKRRAKIRLILIKRSGIRSDRSTAASGWSWGVSADEEPLTSLGAAVGAPKRVLGRPLGIGFRILAS